MAGGKREKREAEAKMANRGATSAGGPGRGGKQGRTRHGGQKRFWARRTEVGGFGSDFLASVSSAVLSLGPPALPPPVRASFLPWAPGRSSPPSRGSRFPLVRSSLVFFLLAVGWTRYKKAVAYCACAEMCTWECAGPFEPRFGTLFSTLLPEPVPRPYPGPMYVPMYTPRLDAGYPMYGPSHKCS
jgi:hypothetical protein